MYCVWCGVVVVMCVVCCAVVVCVCSEKQENGTKRVNTRGGHMVIMAWENAKHRKHWGKYQNMVSCFRTMWSTMDPKQVKNGHFPERFFLHFSWDLPTISADPHWSLARHSRFHQVERMHHHIRPEVRFRWRFKCSSRFTSISCNILDGVDSGVPNLWMSPAWLGLVGQDHRHFVVFWWVP